MLTTGSCAQQAQQGSTWGTRVKERGGSVGHQAAQLGPNNPNKRHRGMRGNERTGSVGPRRQPHCRKNPALASALPGCSPHLRSRQRRQLVSGGGHVNERVQRGPPGSTQLYESMLCGRCHAHVLVPQRGQQQRNELLQLLLLLGPRLLRSGRQLDQQPLQLLHCQLAQRGRSGRRLQRGRRVWHKLRQQRRTCGGGGAPRFGVR